MSTKLNINDTIMIGFIILLIFLVMCKCSTGGEFFNSNTNVQMNDKDVGLYYGSTPMILGSPYGLNYIRVNNKNEIEVPNSKTALRRLMDEGSYKCRTLETDHDNLPSSYLLKKQSIDDIVNLKRIQSQTKERNNIVSSQ